MKKDLNFALNLTLPHAQPKVTPHSVCGFALRLSVWKDQCITNIPNLHTGISIVALRVWRYSIKYTASHQIFNM